MQPNFILTVEPVFADVKLSVLQGCSLAERLSLHSVIFELHGVKYTCFPNGNAQRLGEDHYEYWDGRTWVYPAPQGGINPPINQDWAELTRQQGYQNMWKLVVRFMYITAYLQCYGNSAPRNEPAEKLVDDLARLLKTL